MDFYMPVKLFTGIGCIASHVNDLCTLGRKCLIVTGRNSALKSGALDDVTSACDTACIQYVIFNGITENPSVTSCMEAGIFASKEKVDFIVGIGGGSPLDAAKAVSVFAANPELDEKAFYNKEWSISPLPIVLVGTTAGTGSEVTDVSVLTDSVGRKHSIHDPRMFASISFGNPLYTVSLPNAVTASSGIDVIAHCTESYFSKKANELSRAFSVRGVSRAWKPLEKLASGQELSLEDRTALYEASILGGLAICITGTCFPHNVGYYLTENYQVPHGIACAFFLSDLLDHAFRTDEEYANGLFVSAGVDVEKINDLVDTLLPKLGIHMTDEQIIAVLPRWENNGSVRNTIGSIDTAYISDALKRHFQ